MKFALLDILIRSATIYCFILVLLRLAGKRHIGQMTPIDFVFLLLLSNAVQNAMTGPDTSLLGGITAALTLFITSIILSKVMHRSRFFKTWVEGSPTILINQGKVLQAHLKQEDIDEDELMQVLRAHGIDRIESVRTAVLERDGSISIIKDEDIHASHANKPYHRIKSLKH